MPAIEISENSSHAQRESTSRIASLLDRHSEGILTCVHCGLCLPSCPTYKALGDENDSPRGRIYLMRGLVEGRIEPGDAFTRHIDLCLGCRACESVCPSGVPYGELLEAARVESAIQHQEKKTPFTIATRLILLHVFTRPWLLGLMLAGAKLIRDSGLAELALQSGLVSGRLAFALAMLASTKPRSLREFVLSRRSKSGADPGSTGPAGPRSTLRETGRPRSLEPAARSAALLSGCVMDGLFRHTNDATGRVLERNGVQILRARGQACCGALHSHAGEIEAARGLARRNIDAFLAAGPRWIVVNAAGCGAAMKEYGHLLADDSGYAARAREFSAKVRDVSEVLAETGTIGAEFAVACTVAYDAACHLVHAQRIRTQPLQMLKAVPGVQMAALKGSEDCCGGAGIYNLLQPGLSSEILSSKLDNILECRADLVATSNPGCLMQIGAGLLLAGARIQVAQPVDLLDQCYG